MPVPNPRSILKPEVVLLVFLRMRSAKKSWKTPLECRFGPKFPTRQVYYIVFHAEILILSELQE